MDQDKVKLWSTIEPQHLVVKAYPTLVHAYKELKNKPKKATKRKKKADVEQIDAMLKNISISEPKPKKKIKNVKTIDTYFKKSSVKISQNGERTGKINGEVELDNARKRNELLKENKIAGKKVKSKRITNENVNSTDEETDKDFKTKEFLISSTPMKQQNKSLDFSNFSDEDTENLSEIIEDIVKRKPPREILRVIEKNYLLNLKEKVEHMHESSFFVLEKGEDLFEKTLDIKNSSGGDSTEEYVFDEEYFKNMQHLREEESKSIEDKIDDENKDKNESFQLQYVPLAERLKKQLL